MYDKIPCLVQCNTYDSVNNKILFSLVKSVISTNP